MKIIADENIPCVKQAFASLGEVTLLAGRSMQAQHVQDADILLVRSVTRVDESLLDGSAVRFVGSATIGFDHVDLDYLARRGIGFATAPGSNATSAAEYILSAIMVLSERTGFDPGGKTVGIIGHGNVGSRVRCRLEALGMHCLVNDPPLQSQGGHDEYVDLDHVLQADVVTVHVPYTRAGRWPTHHLVDADFLARLRPDSILLNTSRGAVADNPALVDWLTRCPDAATVLDVWEGEPAISLELMKRVALATPHIAGYSLDGKLRGTDMIYRAACEFLGRQPAWQVESVLPVAAPIDLAVTDPDDWFSTVRAAVLAGYDIRADDARLRAMQALAADERPAFFDRLRREYPVRREFSAITVRLDTAVPKAARVLGQLGFREVSVDGESAAHRAGRITG
ncbi:MAG: 4-phosphoerythronate dehydrogenase PdxB [Gammaproteobacteria bacterium]